MWPSESGLTIPYLNTYQSQGFGLHTWFCLHNSRVLTLFFQKLPLIHPPPHQSQTSLSFLRSTPTSKVLSCNMAPYLNHLTHAAATLPPPTNHYSSHEWAPIHYAQHPPQPFDLPTNPPQFITPPNIITNPASYIPQGSSHPARHHFTYAYNSSPNLQTSDHLPSQQPAPILSHPEPHLTSVNPATNPEAVLTTRQSPPNQATNPKVSKFSSHGTTVPLSRRKTTTELPQPKRTRPAANLPTRKQPSKPTSQQATSDSDNGTGQSDTSNKVSDEEGDVTCLNNEDVSDTDQYLAPQIQTQDLGPHLSNHPLRPTPNTSQKTTTSMSSLTSEQSQSNHHTPNHINQKLTKFQRLATQFQLIHHFTSKIRMVYIVRTPSPPSNPDKTITDGFACTGDGSGGSRIGYGMLHSVMFSRTVLCELDWIMERQW